MIKLRKILSQILLSFCFSIVIFVNSQILTSDLLGLGAGKETAEEIANKTYVQEQSDLQRKIFRKYDRKIRPVVNQSQPIVVAFHVYLMHFSIDQLQQVITLNGHIYMTWMDEVAIWNPAHFNNIRVTMAKQWELWNPEIRVMNSVSGVNQYFEISKRSHASLTSVYPNKTKVEIYPTFSIRVGCNFDYTDFPSDIQNCVVRLYSTNVMSEVELNNFYDMKPSVMLGWGNQSEKRHISDWELVSVHSNLSYYKNQEFSRVRPMSAFESQKTWTMILVWIELKRNATHFWVALGLPALVATVINLFSFTTRPEHSIVLVIANFFIQSAFTRDAINELPPAVGNAPRIVRYGICLIFVTTVVLCLHLCSYKLLKKNLTMSIIPKEMAAWARPVLRCLALGAKDEQVNGASEDNTSLETATPKYPIRFILFRNSCALIYILVVLTLLFAIFAF